MIFIDVDSVIDAVLDALTAMQQIMVQIGGFQTDLLALYIGILVVDIVIYFITTFTHPGGDE